MGTFIIVLISAILGVLIYAARKPDSFRVERSVSIPATPEHIFPLLNDFHQWEAWSPWEKIDPAVQRIYHSTTAGVGATYEWKGNNKVGHGKMEIIESIPSTRVRLKIDFISPFEAHNTVEFTLTPQGNTTLLTQAMYGPSPFVSKLVSMFCSMDKMVGEKYEQGLASIKTLATQPA
jgi:uncharacterized protein YndB with AHSA1/START domain